VTAPVIASKVVNALVEDAQVRADFNALAKVSGPETTGQAWVLDRFRQHYGGLWVGGRLTLTTRTLEFHPNALNRFANAGTLDITIELRDIAGVELQPGVATKIIAVYVGARVFKSRCYGARQMADHIRTAAAAVHAAPEPQEPSVAPGWYPDPTDPRALCWWDGTQWHPGSRYSP
jgi:hypothetical protein